MSTNLNQSYVAARRSLVEALNSVGLTEDLAEISDASLGSIQWHLTTLAGVLEAEQVKRDGTSDFAAEAQVGG